MSTKVVRGFAFPVGRATRRRLADRDDQSRSVRPNRRPAASLRESRSVLASQHATPARVASPDQTLTCGEVR
jgi:hypothetical protein